MFCLVESFRYLYYLVKQLGLEHKLFGRVLGFIRYNSFIVCYPIGAIGENIVMWYAIDKVRDD